jgi:Tfp pilus assembly protein PilF
LNRARAAGGIRHRRAAAALVAACAGALAAGCAAAPPTVGLAESLRQRGVPPEALEPIEVSDEMRAFARSKVPRLPWPKLQLEALLASLLEREEAPFLYTSGAVTSAREAWRTGRANCLTFAHVFVALAREIGLDAYYLRVGDLMSYEKQGDLIVAADHVTAAFGRPQERLILDFSSQPTQGYRNVDRISDLAALALHYSTLGAERIRAGDLAGARDLLDLSVRIEPTVADGWLNLGVVQMREQDVAGAERSYRRALEADPQRSSAYANLARLLDVGGRDEEAREIRALAQRADNRNPYSYLALGDIALRERRLDDAESLYRRARRLAPDDAETAAALGRVALERGRRRAARNLLDQAELIDAGHPRVVALARALDRPPPAR